MAKRMMLGAFGIALWVRPTDAAMTTAAAKGWSAGLAQAVNVRPDALRKRHNPTGKIARYGMKNGSVTALSPIPLNI